MPKRLPKVGTAAFAQGFADELTFLMTIGQRFHLELDAQTVLYLIAQLQLAQRHPNNDGEPARAVRRFIDSVILVASTVAPHLSALMKMGNDPRHDAMPNPNVN